MAFELDDQTDEDFFDKLVDSDDDHVVGPSLSEETGIAKPSVVVSDGNESDEIKAFANLSLGETISGSDHTESSVGRPNEGEALANLGLSGTSVASSGSEVKGAVGSLEEKVSDNLVGFENGQAGESGVSGSEVMSDVRGESSGSPSGVKEVQWSAFADTAGSGSGNGIGGFGSYDDLFSDFGVGQGAAGNVPSQANTGVLGFGVGQVASGNVSSQPNSGVVNGAVVSATVPEVTATGSLYGQTEENVNWEDPNSVQYYESMYPGWKYDPNSGQWYQLDSSDGTVVEQVGATGGDAQGNVNVGGIEQWGVSNVETSQVSNAQKTALSAAETQFVAGTSDNVSGWNNVPRQSEYYQYPAHMVFDPQFPGWYYDSIAQQWYSLDEYHASTHTLGHTNNAAQPWASPTNNNNNDYSQGNPQENDKIYPKSDSNVYNFASGVNGNAFQQMNHSPPVQQNEPSQYPTGYYNNVSTQVSQSTFSNGHHASKSSAGRPPHALVSFGFGGKLVVMKDSSATGFSFQANKDEGRFLSVLSLMEVVGVNSSPYFSSLCHQSFPGPLVGGSARTQDVHKWIDERIANSEPLDMNYGQGQAPKLLLSLLRIAYDHYGKFRSFGTDIGLKETVLPESAVANVFVSAKRNFDQFNQYSAAAKCVTTLPSEAHIQTTASEVQNLLISGKKKEALQRAREGQFWGFALIIARELGEEFYNDTVKEMAVCQLVVGSPLRTLCLLIAKRPEDVFSNNIVPAGNLPGAVSMASQTVQSAGHSMLDNWEENLAVIAANRTDNDHFVITHLGDCLWKDKNNVTAAHICYLLAETELESYSDSARICLIGTDHWSFPRTYASPEAIQRTELFEYAKCLGNSQFVLLTLQPYKLLYAHMLVEVGKTSDALRYCQAASKSLKTGRSAEGDTVKQLLVSLEERIKAHQQSGYAANLAPKILGKIYDFFDSTAHRVVGTLPPPVPSTAHGSGLGHEHNLPTPNHITGTPPTMGMPSLMPSASMEPISQWAVDGSKMTLPNRSISEPDIGRTSRPDQVDTSNEATSSGAEVKQSGSKGTSRLGRLSFGSQILQRTVGLVLKPRQGRQAKLGDENKFYYDEKLKQWVEEGAAPPAEEPALPPPPTNAAFQNEKAEHNFRNGFANGFDSPDNRPESTTSIPPGGSLGIPAIPNGLNQFSARGRMGVRSRYVDTFNKGGGASTNVFQAPSVSSAKPAGLPGAKFFIPSAPSATEQTFGAEAGNIDGTSDNREQKFSNPVNDPFQNLSPSPAVAMQRFSSMGNIPNKGTVRSGNSSVAPESRRAASWSDMQRDAYTPPSPANLKASPIPFMPSNRSSGSLHNSGGSFGDDLQEVEL